MNISDYLSIFAIVFALFNGILFSVLVVIYGERKVLARLQQRIGPSRTGPWGIFQTLADAVKLVLKEEKLLLKLLIFTLIQLLILQ